MTACKSSLSSLKAQKIVSCPDFLSLSTTLFVPVTVTNHTHNLAPFQGGTWKVHVELPDNYPYKSPSIGFQNKIFHPNIEESSGSVCLDVINQTWSPMFDVFNIFEIFLPQLLRYPNPRDPMNTHAGALMIKDTAAYEAKIREYVKKYASNSDLKVGDDDDSDSDAELSAVSDLSDDDDDDDDDMEDEDEDANDDENVAGEMEM